MSCYHPLKAFPIGLTESGKTDYKITSYETQLVYQTKSGSWIATDIDFPPAVAVAFSRDFVEIPCGKCIGCRLEYSRQWANRCMLELQYHKSAYFITLTYDDIHVPRSFYGDPETGEAKLSLTLRKRDFQLFMKRLRKRFPDSQLRFFAAGEYGSKTFRPHYHAIIFGLELPDLKVYKQSNGFVYYNSQILQDAWSIVTPAGREPLGFAVAANVTWETCAYTARYVMKKLNGAEAQFYTDFNLEPEFSLMSRKPGIARQYYDEHMNDIYKHDEILISTDKGGRKFKPPRYYDALFDLDQPDQLAEIKEARQRAAEAAQKLKLSKTNLSYLQMLEVEERSKSDKIKRLERKL